MHSVTDRQTDRWTAKNPNLSQGGLYIEYFGADNIILGQNILSVKLNSQNISSQYILLYRPDYIVLPASKYSIAHPEKGMDTLNILADRTATQYS